MDNDIKIKFEIEISVDDYKEIEKTCMSINDMYNTLNGRIYSAIVHGVKRKAKEIEDNNEKSK